MAKGNIFTSVPMRKPRKNVFDLSHEVKLTCNMGPLIPVLNMEVLPGDRVRGQLAARIRFLALLAPLMHRVNVWFHAFFVPYRLLWSNWQTFITGGSDGLQTPAMPFFSPQNVNAASPTYLMNGSLLDYLGFPTMKTTGETYSTNYNGVVYNGLALRAYAFIYDNYYRDQNLEASILTANFTADGSITGADLLALLPLRQRAWEKDYFTSALPWVQRGNPVSVPITSTITAIAGAGNAIVRDGSTGGSLGSLRSLAAVPAAGSLGSAAAPASDRNAYIDPNGTLVATSSSLTINALRLSNAIQMFLEKNARGGARYIEQIFAHFGVISSDARLQRPEYLGGGVQPVQISEVVTMAASGTNPAGTLNGHGISDGSSNVWKLFAEEHGVVMVLMSVLPRTGYQDQIHPMWSRFANTDYAFPVFAHLGEQVVESQEVYCRWADAGSNAAALSGTFGYQSRYAEYKYIADRVAGQFKETLNFWTMARVFSSKPVLNASFVQSNPTTGIFAVTTDVHHLVVDIYHEIKVKRALPYYADPSLMPNI